jgi:UDP-glucose 4-epimerase
MDLAGKRIGVIGGAGLIGSHTVDALVREDVAEILVYDNFVRGTLDNLAGSLTDPRVRVFEAGGDICQRDILDAALSGIDGVFHFAALWLLQCYEYPETAFEVNVRGSFNVFRSCLTNNVKRLVFSSSASVYGDAIEEPMSEDHPFNNQNFYGATKIADEAIVHALHHRYGLDYVGLRYMNVYGPRQDYEGAYVAVIMKMLDAIDRDEPLSVYGDGSQAYDFIYVGDAADANVAAMRAGTTDDFYNVGTGRRTTILELAELLVRITGTDRPIEFLPGGLTFVQNRIGSTVKARREIGFEASVDLELGVKQLIEWRQGHKAAVEARRRQARG